MKERDPEIYNKTSFGVKKEEDCRNFLGSFFESLHVLWSICNVDSRGKP